MERNLKRHLKKTGTKSLIQKENIIKELRIGENKLIKENNKNMTSLHEKRKLIENNKDENLEDIYGYEKEINLKDITKNKKEYDVIKETHLNKIKRYFTTIIIRIENFIKLLISIILFIKYLQSFEIFHFKRKDNYNTSEIIFNYWNNYDINICNENENIKNDLSRSKNSYLNLNIIDIIPLFIIFLFIISKNKTLWKRKPREIKKNKKNFKINIVFSLVYIKYLIILSLFIGNSKEKEFVRLVNCFSNISLKVRGTGYKIILGHAKDGGKPHYFDTKNYPNEIHINGEKQEGEITYQYNFKQEINYVELIWYKNIKNASCMFHGGSGITEIDFSNFNTSEITNMYYMFRLCSSLTSINFANFDTSKVTEMSCFFASCSSLTSLDLSMFITSKVKQMHNMFNGCSSLTSLDLSNFDTSQTTCINSIFYGCSSLTSLNLSNFDFSNMHEIMNFFNGCNNLEYINLANFDETGINKYSNMFANVPHNLVICIDPNKIKNRIKNVLDEKKCHVIDCSDNWKSKQKKIQGSNICMDDCDINSEYKYEYNGKCIENCPNGIINEQPFKCKCQLEQCLTCPQVALNKQKCLQCNINYYPIENNLNDLGEYINCYKKPKGYYLDKNYSIYKKCYERCEICEIKGDNITHNCLECISDYLFSVNISNYLNCYENSSYYYLFVKEHEILETTYLYDEKDFTTYINEEKYKTTYITYINEEEILTIHNIFELIKNDTEEKENKVKYYDNILENIEKLFTSENYDTSKIDKGKDEIIQTEKMNITLTTTQIQKNKKNENITTIDLGECEILLRKFYNISNNKTIYIKKLDIFQEGNNQIKIEYDVYNKLSENNLEKLNLSICRNSDISLSIPFIISENLDKLNSSSGYFNDICYTATSDSGTDISLKDRKIEFVEGNKSICQEDCYFSEYNYTSKKAKCTCKAKESSPSFANMKINKTKLYQNFIDFKNIANVKFLVCFENLFSKIGLIKNIGSYILILIFFLHIVFIIVFFNNQLIKIKKKIKDIIYAKKNYNLYNSDKKEKKMDVKSKKINKINKNKNKKKKGLKNKDKYKFKAKKNESEFISKSNQIITGNFHLHGNLGRNNKKKNIIQKSLGKKVLEKIKNIMKYNDDEKNDLSYGLALQYDKRTYCEYYISLIKTNHSLIFAFFNSNDYNSRIIKIDSFFVDFATFYVINALFYNDETMHNIYVNEGSFDLEYQLSQIIYSSLISMVINTLCQFLRLSNNNIIEFKQSKKEKNVEKKGNKLLNKLTIKFILYFILSTILLLGFWYYISMFGAIYKNTQIHLLKDTLISFGLGLITPFGIYLLPGFFRIPALSSPKKERRLLYNFSKILQMF